MPALYDLDRLDVTAYSTLDAPGQAAASQLLRSLREPATLERLGLVGEKLLGGGDPARVLYSVTIYERGSHANRIRIQTDNLDQPLDINEGARIDLGSTAKLRTLISYLEAIAALHDRYARLAPAELAAARPHPKDRMGAWALEYLTAARGTDKTLQAMLEASLERKYSASPAEAFFTGGGLHTFGNFDREDDRKVMTIREAFAELGQPRLHPPDARRGHQPSLRDRELAGGPPGRSPRPAPRSLPDPLRGSGGQRVRPALLPEVPGPGPRRAARARAERRARHPATGCPPRCARSTRR